MSDSGDSDDSRRLGPLAHPSSTYLRSHTSPHSNVHRSDHPSTHNAVTLQCLPCWCPACGIRIGRIPARDSDPRRRDLPT